MQHGKDDSIDILDIKYGVKIYTVMVLNGRICRKVDLFQKIEFLTNSILFELFGELKVAWEKKRRQFQIIVQIQSARNRKSSFLFSRVLFSSNKKVITVRNFTISHTF